MQALPHSCTLCVLFLATLYLREAVNPLDIVRWSLNGVLPYMRFATDSRDLLEPYRTVIAESFVTPTGLVQCLYYTSWYALTM